MAPRRSALPEGFKGIVTPLVISAALVIPFVVLQWVNRRTYGEGLPVLLFTIMSVHALLVVLLLSPTVRCVRATKRLGALTLSHWAGISLGVVLAVAYVGALIDQLPCVLGVPNCD